MTEELKKFENLKNSPLFNLSLSSRELFHSNFLCWLGESHKVEFGEIFKDFLKILPEDNDFKIKEIHREKDNIDLSFTYSNGQEIILENKVKSIAYIEQLKKYSEKNTDKKNYILLSLSKPVFFNTEDKFIINGTDINGIDAVWNFLSYSKLIEMLKTLSEKIQDSYHQNIINDYCNFIDGLIEIESHCNLAEDDCFPFEKNKIFLDIKEIRLHDFYLKRKYELLAFQVSNKIKETKEVSIFYGSLSNWEKQKDKPIYIGHGMTRGLGLMDIKYKISTNVSLGIQIQGDHYRMVVENTVDLAGIAEKILEEKLWFDFSENFDEKEVYPKGEKEFNKYGATFFYKSVNLASDPNLSISDLIQFILNDLNKIEANKDEILKLIHQHSK